MTTLEVAVLVGTGVVLLLCAVLAFILPGEPDDRDQR